MKEKEGAAKSSGDAATKSAPSDAPVEVPQVASPPKDVPSAATAAPAAELAPAATANPPKTAEAVEANGQ